MNEIKRVRAAIKFARIERNLSQREAAALCGWHKNRWQRLEAGESTIELGTLTIVCKALKMKLKKLFSD